MEDVRYLLPKDHVARSLDNWVLWVESVEKLQSFYSQELPKAKFAIRLGQALFNMLARDFNRSDLTSEAIRTLDTDPFNQDRHIPAFLEFVDKNW